MTPVDQIHAITLCINYSDYLTNTLANRAHFEKWTIVTCPQDEDTIRLCERAGLDLLVTDCLGPGAEAFDSAYSKGEILNWALDAIRPENWVALLDADTLLPRYFRPRLDAMQLSQRALYGLYGRRDCLT